MFTHLWQELVCVCVCSQGVPDQDSQPSELQWFTLLRFQRPPSPKNVAAAFILPPMLMEEPEEEK